MSEEFGVTSAGHKRIFVTGASGCIGHYIVDALIQQTSHELFLLVRDPKKLQFDYRARSGITILQGDLREIDCLSNLLKTIDVAILTATVWGGDDVYEVNVKKTLELMSLLDLDLCQQVIYFSTESILGQDNQLMPEAAELGTPYIRSKYLCHQQLFKQAIASKVTTLFPTLVFGGDAHKPYSQVSAGLPDVLKWIGLVRFIKADGSFHYVHAQDVARVVAHLIEHPPAPGQPRDLVLGNAAVTVNEAIAEICAYLRQRIYFQIPLSMRLADILIALFRVQVAEWDRFCLRYRHFTHQNPVTPASLGLPVYCGSIAELLKLSGVPPK